MKSKIKNNLSLIILYSMTVIICFAYPCIDYVGFSFNIGVVTTASYWIKVCVNLAILLCLALSSYFTTKTQEIESSDEITNLSSQIRKAYAWVADKNYSSKVDAYIEVLNKGDKYALYRRYWLAKCSRAKKPSKRAKYQKRLDKTIDEVWAIKLSRKYHYKPIKYNMLFQGAYAKDIGYGPHDIYSYEASSISNLLGSKVLCTFLFSAFTAGYAAYLLSQELTWIAIVIALATKIMQMAMTIYAGFSHGKTYVQANLLTALRNRYGIIKEFRSHYDITPEVPTQPVDSNSTN